MCDNLKHALPNTYFRGSWKKPLPSSNTPSQVVLSKNLTLTFLPAQFSKNSRDNLLLPIFMFLQIKYRFAIHTSFPQQSHPSAVCRAKSSIRGRSPKSSTIRALTSSGLRLCSLMWVKTTERTARDCRFKGLPRVASRQYSAFARV